MKTREAMTSNVATIRADASIADAMRLMVDRRISGLPVVDAAGTLVGIVTEGDFLRRAELATERRRPRWLEFVTSPGRLAADYTSSHARKVDEVMTRSLVTVDVDATLADALTLMDKHHVKRLPVLANGHLAGMFSRADILRAYLSLKPEESKEQPSDAAILRRIEAEIDAQPWCPQSIRVNVDHGAAEISGVITDDRMRDAIRVLVENVAGVHEVADRLVTVEPMSGLVVSPPPG